MVSASIHYVLGVLIARYYGYRDNKYTMGLWALLPDLDFLLVIFGFLFTGPDWLFAHRAFSHSFFLVAIIWFLLKGKYRNTATLIVLSHLLLDWFTPWKSYFLVPFSFKSFHLGLVDIFDPVLTVLAAVIFAFLLSEDFLDKTRKYGVMFGSYLLFLLTGVLPSIMTRELNPTAVILANATIALVLAYFWFGKGTHKIFKDGITYACYAITAYMVIIVAIQGYHSATLDIPLSNIEPMSTYEFSGLDHTFENDLGDSYEVGIVGLKGVKIKKTIPKYVYEDKEVDITEIEEAYQNMVSRNWVNNPVWHIHTEGETIFARPVYAKAYIIEDENSQYSDHEGFTIFKNSTIGTVRRRS